MGLPEAVQGSNLRPQLLAIGDVLPLGHGGLLLFYCYRQKNPREYKGIVS